MSLKNLLSPLRIGGVQLHNRVVMAPLTRNRAAQPGDVPTELNVAYYQQRADAGLIVTEGTQISRQGQGYFGTPGLYTDEQEAGWEKVVDAVHAKDGRMSLQLWHVGRVSHSLLQADRERPVAPSAIRAEDTTVFVRHDDGSFGMIAADTPRALEAHELPGIIEQYVAAAERAKRVGFDMVEVHAANGYLLHQFLSAHTNLRTDNYGGSVQNRARLVIEIVEAVQGVFGRDRVGIRVSPNFTAFGMSDHDAEDTVVYLAGEMNRLGAGYIHVAEPDWVGGKPLSDAFRFALRATYSGQIIAAGNYTAQAAEARIREGIVDAVAFGRAFIANPDLVTRLRRDAPLNEPDPATFFGGDAKGYTDYPELEAEAA
ncbi:alkene reductase [Pandoraea sp. PE-S2T-3]|uniref:alkene reductase n=1 Tax=Pandoraea sp. PE-S2T-3 TaxID=1986993 RepID=UPI000B401271|nr:alkene reductase [Pandoraea sp. PE-S2T-3]